MKDKIFVVTACRFSTQKGLTFLLKAAAKCILKNSNLYFIIAGDGEERENLQNLAKNLHLGSHISFPGYLRGDKLKSLYRKADIFVMSSVSEPFGLTALEAVSSGTALILTDTSGVANYLPSAPTYSYQDIEKLTNTILRLAASKSEREKIITMTKKEAQKLSWDASALSCIDLYSSLNFQKPAAKS